MAKREFTKTFGETEYRFTPGGTCTMHGTACREWECWRKHGRDWVFWGKTILPQNKNRGEIVEALV